MKLTRMTIFTVIVAFVAIVLFNTFRQEAFLVPVTVKLFFKETTPIPVIYYIAGAFVIGLSIGTAIAVAEHFTMGRKVRLLKKEIATREKDLADSASEVYDFTAESEEV